MPCGVATKQNKAIWNVCAKEKNEEERSLSSDQNALGTREQMPWLALDGVRQFSHLNKREEMNIYVYTADG